MNVNLKNVAKQNKCTWVILLGAETISTRYIKIEGVAFISKKNSLNHTSESQKSFFFNFVF